MPFTQDPTTIRSSLSCKASGVMSEIGNRPQADGLEVLPRSKGQEAILPLPVLQPWRDQSQQADSGGLTLQSGMQTIRSRCRPCSKRRGMC